MARRSKLVSILVSNSAGAALAVVLVLGAVAAHPAAAGQVPPGLLDMGREMALPPVFVAETIDPQALMAEADAVAALAVGAVPLRFAVPQEVSLTAATAGRWSEAEDGWNTWRLEIHTPGALSQYARLENLELPRDAKLWLYDAGGAQVRGPFTAADRGRKGGFTAPIILGERMILEVLAPAIAREAELFEVTEIYRGYRFFAEDPAKRGLCNINVVCPEGDSWRDQIRAVAFYISAGSVCSGTLVNNTAGTDIPYFLTAGHCNVDADNAHAITVYWNYQTATCEDFFGGDLSQFQSGATLVAAWGDVGSGSTEYGADMKLLQLDAMPDEAFNVHLAGWDVSSNVPQAVTGIHHPRGDEKSICFENDPVDVTSYVDFYGDDNWLRVNDWDLGTTEAGSPGSCIFDQSSGLCVGSLSGGYAACGNDEPDWYGWLHRQWEGGGTPETRLKDWLDPLDLQFTSLQGRDPGIVVLFSDGFESGDTLAWSGSP